MVDFARCVNAENSFSLQGPVQLSAAVNIDRQEHLTDRYLVHALLEMHVDVRGACFVLLAESDQPVLEFMLVDGDGSSERTALEGEHRQKHERP